MSGMEPLSACRPGLFWFNGNGMQCLGFKSEYKTESKSHPGFWQSDAYVVESGEYFWGGTSDPTVRESLLVESIEPTPLSPAGGDGDVAERIVAEHCTGIAMQDAWRNGIRYAIVTALTQARREATEAAGKVVRDYMARSDILPVRIACERMLRSLTSEDAGARAKGG